MEPQELNNLLKKPEFFMFLNDLERTLNHLEIKYPEFHQLTQEIKALICLKIRNKKT